MAKRLKTLNLCDLSVERLNKATMGQSAFARQAILSHDRICHEKWELERDLQHQEAMTDLQRSRVKELIRVILHSYAHGWTVEGMLTYFLDKEAAEVQDLDQDGYLAGEIRVALNRFLTSGGD